MSLAGFKAKNRPQQTSVRGVDVDQDDRATHMLLPGDRTEQQFWQLMVEPYRDRPGSPLTTTFLPGRMRFIKPGRTAIERNSRPPFGCVLLVWQHQTDHHLVWNPNSLPPGGLFNQEGTPA